MGRLLLILMNPLHILHSLMHWKCTKKMHLFICQISENLVNNPNVQFNGNPAFVKVLTGPTWAGIHIESA